MSVNATDGFWVKCVLPKVSVIVFSMEEEEHKQMLKKGFKLIRESHLLWPQWECARSLCIFSLQFSETETLKQIIKASR